MNECRNEYAEFAGIKTKTIMVQGQRGDSKKAKLFITLKRSKDFYKNMENFENIRKENENLKQKQAEEKKEEEAKEKKDEVKEEKKE